MILGIGVDIVEIRRIREILAKDNGFLEKIFTSNEIEYLRRRNLRPEYVAGRFAAKEAVSKALGTGFVTFEMTDIEILKDEKGKPFVKLYKGARVRADELGVNQIHVSISHCQSYATAFAITERGNVSETCN